MVPLPRGTELSGTHLAHPTFGRANRSVSLPMILHNAHTMGQRARLMFVITVRNPLKRMQSAYYHARSTNFKSVCMDCSAPTFKGALLASIAQAERHPPNYHDWLWRSLIDLHLPEWLKFFNAKQFYIVPLGVLIRTEYHRNVCDTIAEKLGAPLLCKESVPHENKHSHPPIEDEKLEPELLARFHRLMQPHRTQSSAILSRMYLQGSVMANFTGSVKGVDDWVKHWWKSI